jgi:hypothetical protein
MEFWAAAPHPGGISAFLVASIDKNPPSLEYLDEVYVDEDAQEFSPVIWLNESIPFAIQRRPGTQEPYLITIPLRETWPNKFEIGLDQAISVLFDSVDFSRARNMLIDLQESPGLLCEPFWQCDRYFYFLGLTNELNRFERQSVDAYLTLWRDNLSSPYATIARMKLVGPTINQTVTPTATKTQIVVTATPSPTGATFTPSLTPDLTNTVTPSPTATNGPYP